VDVIGHQAPPPDVQPGDRGALAEVGQISAPIVVIEKNIAAPIATVRDMIRYIDGDGSGDSAHGRMLLHLPGGIKPFQWLSPNFRASMRLDEPMRSISSRLVSGLAALLLAVGGGLFFLWLSRTDFMFGHYKGPLWLLATGGACALLGEIAGLMWLIDRVRERSRPKSGETNHRRPHPLGCLATAGLILLMLLGAIVICVCIAELQEI
jgi:hypothetical protein